MNSIFKPNIFLAVYYIDSMIIGIDSVKSSGQAGCLSAPFLELKSCIFRSLNFITLILLRVSRLIEDC